MNFQPVLSLHFLSTLITFLDRVLFFRISFPSLSSRRLDSSLFNVKVLQFVCHYTYHVAYNTQKHMCAQLLFTKKIKVNNTCRSRSSTQIRSASVYPSLSLLLSVSLPSFGRGLRRGNLCAMAARAGTIFKKQKEKRKHPGGLIEKAPGGAF